MAVAEPKEVKAARAKVRAKEADAWNKVEAAGRTARQAESAQGAKVGAKASTDDADDKAKRRQGMTA